MNKMPKITACLLLIKLLLFSTFLANAQNRTVRGRVTSADKGAPLTPGFP